MSLLAELSSIFLEILRIFCVPHPIHDFADVAPPLSFHGMLTNHLLIRNTICKPFSLRRLNVTS